MLAVALCGGIFVVSQFFFPPPPPAEPAPAEGIAAPDAAEPVRDGEAKGEPQEPAQAGEPGAAAALAVEHQIENDALRLRLSNRSPADGGLVLGAHLKDAQFEGHETADNAFGLDGMSTLEVSFADTETDFRVPRAQPLAVRDQGPTHFTLVHEAQDVEIIERLEILTGYQGRLEVSVTNRTQTAQQHRLHVRTRVGVRDGNSYDLQRGLCRLQDDFEAEDRSDVEDESVTYTAPVLWAGVDSKYFGTLVVPEEAGTTCEVSLSSDGRFILNDLGSATAKLGPGETRTHNFGVFLGPKELGKLREFSAVPLAQPGDLERAIDWGYLGFVSESLGKLLLGMLRWFYAVTGAWGWAIVLLTIVVKVLTLPLTLKQMASMKAMKRIQPEMEQIKKKYASDNAKQGQELQALFARSGVNPLAGCLPLLVQLPIWVALYAMLGAVVELVHEPFLWLPDLTQQDPYYLLPLSLGVMMMVQNRMMPMSGDETQAQLMRWVMPIVFTAFMLFLPSGLGVYIFVNTVLSVIQTAIQVGRKDEATEAKK